MHYQTWYDDNYANLSGHGIWLRGQELNRLPIERYDSATLKVLLVRLSTYFDTGYSFTHQILYQIAARLPGVFPDLGFLPPPADAKIFDAHNVPWLLGTHTKFGPQGFDLIGISNSIVQELINIPSLLSKSGIPLSKHERLARPDLPLLIMGGANALYSSVLWNKDPMIDGIFVGESDVGIRNIFSLVQTEKESGANKSEILDKLESINGFFQPDKPRSTRKFFIPNLGESESLESAPVYYLAEQVGSSHLQISEGCPCFCSFCAESWDRKPYRERRADKLKETARKLKAGMGLDEIDIYSFNFNMHSDFYEVLWDLVPLFRRIGLKSQRFDLLAHDPAMIEFQHTIEKASITCGLEGISPRLRKYLHKNLENEQLHDSLTAIFKSKARELKVFLIATGLEEEQDFVALDDLLEHMREIHSLAVAGTRVICSMTPLVRFPWTPLEFENAPPMEKYERIIHEVRNRVEKAGFQFRESACLPEYWTSQVLVRAADERIGQAMLATVQKTGFVYYRDVSEQFRAEFERTLSASGITTDELLRGHSLEESKTKPWSLIETGVRREFLWAEVERARAYKEIDYCLGRSWVKSECFRCGGCPTKFHIKDIVLAQQKRGYSLDEFKRHVKTARDNRVEISLLVHAGKNSRGAPRKMLVAAIAQALMKLDPNLIPGYQGFIGSTWSGDSPACWILGQDELKLWWSKPNLPKLLARLSEPLFIAQVNAALGDWGQLLGLAPSGWKALEVTIYSNSPFQGEAFLKSKGLRFTMVKNSSGGYQFNLPKDSIKKNIVLALSTFREDAGYKTVLSPGTKIDLHDFLRGSFAGKNSADWVRAVCTVTRGSPCAASSHLSPPLVGGDSLSA
jgi:radical SAM superfamily enzyme YgiQ (UPF0313 family)